MRGTDRLLCTGRRSTAARTRETSEDIKATGLITVWHDRNIRAGTEWEHEINTHLNAAQIVLMLVSPDFMASDYCYGIEMVQAMKRHDSGEVCVIPIILRPVRWQEAPFSTLQVLPTDAVPVVRLKDQRAHNLSFVTFIISKVIEPAEQKARELEKR